MVQKAQRQLGRPGDFGHGGNRRDGKHDKGAGEIAELIYQHFGVPDVEKDDIFISHIKSHLKEGQEVVCKICGQSAKEIIAAYQKARGKTLTEGV